MVTKTSWILTNHQYLFFFFRSDLLRVEEKARPDHLPTHLPPLLHALDLVVGDFLCSW